MLSFDGYTGPLKGQNLYPDVMHVCLKCICFILSQSLQEVEWWILLPGSEITDSQDFCLIKLALSGDILIPGKLNGSMATVYHF